MFHFIFTIAVNLQVLKFPLFILLQNPMQVYCQPKEYKLYRN